mgnify:CR=1 FL=1
MVSVAGHGGIDHVIGYFDYTKYFVWEFYSSSILSFYTMGEMVSMSTIPDILILKHTGSGDSSAADLGDTHESQTASASIGDRLFSNNVARISL